MNHLALLAGVPAVAMAMTGPADAFTYHPQGTTFVGGGPITVSDSFGNAVSCMGRYKLKTSKNAKNAKITKADFLFGAGCTTLAANGLSWFLTATSTTTADIPMAFSGPVGPCGPGPVTVTLSGNTLSFGQTLNPGGCKVSGSITLNPTLTITNP